MISFLNCFFLTMSEDLFKDRNLEILNLFSKFKGEKNYFILKDKLEELSKFRLREMITLGNIEIPDIGPDPEILNFYLELEDWKEENILEIKYAIKVYEGGSIESLEEAIVLIEILKRQYPEKEEILSKIISDLQNEKFDNLMNYSDLLKIEKNHPNHIIFSSLFIYFASFFE